MKEININIEGYNVNGICVGCLNYNRKMFYRNDVVEFFKKWANIDVPDGLTIQVCWECLAAVTSAVRFRTQILSAFDVLIDYSRQHTFLNSPNDLSKHAKSRLTVTTPELEPTFQPLKEEKIDEVKIEDNDDRYDAYTLDSCDTEGPILDNSPIAQSPKPEGATTDIFIDDINLSEDIPSQDQDASDDEVVLSKLKTKKKRGRKCKKDRSKKKLQDEGEEGMPRRHSRKLKNLPEELVELYTMTEEEMWRIRAEDVERPEFANLKYKCQDCVIGFNTEKLMKYHLNGKHKPRGERTVQCDVCRAHFLTRENVSQHRALHLAAYRCRRCGELTTLKRAMSRHGCARQLAAGHACAVCGQEFSTKSKLTYHRGVCHQERPQCDCCGKVFANKMTLKYHLKILPKEKDKPKEKLYIQCKGCSKVFHSKKSYGAHVVIHNGLTYPCPICGKLFQWKRNLSRHTRNHRERDAGELHECRDCGKTFSSRDCYNNHMRLSKRHVPEDAYVVNNNKKERQKRYREQSKLNNEEIITAQSSSGSEKIQPSSIQRNDQGNKLNALQKKRARQQRYRERNRDKLKQREAERRERIRHSQSIAGPSTSSKTNRIELNNEEIITAQISSGSEKMQPLSIQRNDQGNKLNALQKKRERQRQQRYREQNRDKLKQREAKRRRRLRNADVITELSTSPNIELTEIINHPIIDKISTNSRNVSGLEEMQHVVVEDTYRILQLPSTNCHSNTVLRGNMEYNYYRSH